MSRVRIEIYPDDEDFNNTQQVEVYDPDVRGAFDRAVKMAQAAIPEPVKEKSWSLGAGSYSFEMKNVQLNGVHPELLFGVDPGFDVRVASDEPPAPPDGRCLKTAPGRGRGNRCELDLGHSGRHLGEIDGWRWSDPDPTPTQPGEPRQPCGQTCRDPDGACTDTCAKPAGHDGWHVTADEACSWGASEKPLKKCARYCDKSEPDCWGRCVREADHGGDCYCSLDHNESLCLNEIGAPSATRNCQQPMGHEGHCDGEQDALMDGLRPPLCLGTYFKRNENNALVRRDCQKPPGHQGECGRVPL